MRKRTLWVIAVLVMAAMACNLQRQNENSPTSVVSPNVVRPSVVIMEPAEGATVTRGQNISVKANATGASGVTLVELRVNNLVVDSQVPAESLNPTTLEVLLDYIPQQTGRTVLSVTAYSNSVAGQPVQRTINVVDSGSSTGVTRTPGTVAPAPTQYNPICRARMNVSLNFRRGPGVEYDIISTFGAGQELPIIGYADRSDGRWWQVSSGGQVGWIKESYTTQLGDCSAIRPAVVPASPTPSPTKTSPSVEPNVTATFTLPDLMLSVLDGPHQIDLDTNNYAEAVYVIIVRNNGGQSSGQFNVGISLPNGQTEDLGMIANLNAGQEIQIPAGGLTVEFDSPGIKRLLVTVDTGNNVAESSEGNNQAYLDITVNGGGEEVATIEVTSESASVQSSISGDPATTGDPLIPGGDAGVVGEGQQQEGSSVSSSSNGDALSGGDTSSGGDFVEGSSSAGGELSGGEGNAGGAVLEGSGEQGGQPIILRPLDASNVSQSSEIAVLQGHGSTVDGLAFDPGATRLASASWDGTIHIWDAATGADMMMLSGHADRVVDVAFSPDGSRLVSAGWDGTAILWDLNTGGEISRFALGAEVNSVAFSPDGSRLVAGGRSPNGGGLARVWDVASGAEIGSVPTSATVSDVLLTSSGQLVVATETGDCDPANSGVGLWDPSSGTLISALPATGPVSALAVNANGALLAGSGQDGCSGNGVVWVWNTGGVLLQSLDQGSGSTVSNIAFGSGTTLAASSGGAIQLWDAREAQLLGSVPGSGGANSVAFSSDGTLVASGGADGNVHLWGAN